MLSNSPHSAFSFSFPALSAELWEEIMFCKKPLNQLKNPQQAFSFPHRLELRVFSPIHSRGILIISKTSFPPSISSTPDRYLSHEAFSIALGSYTAPFFTVCLHALHRQLLVHLQVITLPDHITGGLNLYLRLTCPHCRRTELAMADLVLGANKCGKYLFISGI